MNLQIQESGLYSTECEDGNYFVIKILKIDGIGVHIRQYSNQFVQRPTSLDPTALYMAGIHRKPEERLGVGHTPFSNKSFSTWKIKFIQVEPTTEEELEGYEYWKEAGGGYF